MTVTADVPAAFRRRGGIPDAYGWDDLASAIHLAAPAPVKTPSAKAPPGRPPGKPAAPSRRGPKPVPLAPMRRETAKSMRKLAADVQQSHPDMTAHSHVRLAARQVEKGNEDGAVRHLQAAMRSLSGASLLKHGIHVDDAHIAARKAMGSAVLHYHMVKDIQDADAKNQAAIRRFGGEDDTAPRPADPNAGYGPGANAQKPAVRQPPGDQALNAPGKSDGGGSDPAVADPDAPQKPGSKQFARTWGDFDALLEFSARTAMLESTPAPIGKPGGPGLYHVKNLGHAAYFEQVRNGLMKRGIPEGAAHAMTWGILRRWAAGGGGVHPEVRAAAVKALAEEKAKAAAAHAHSVTRDEVAGVITLTGDARHHHIPGSPMEYEHNYVPLTHAAAASHGHGKVPKGWAPPKGHGDGTAAPSSRTGRDVQAAITAVRKAVEQANAKPDQYGTRNQFERESTETGKALDALAAEASKASPDVQQLGRHTQAVQDGTAGFGSRLQDDPDVRAAMDKLGQAVVEHQTEVATRGMDMSARHLVSTDVSGNKAYHTINDPATRRSYAQQAAVRGIRVEPSAKPFDASGIPKSGQKLLAHAAAHGWNTSVQVGRDSGGNPIYNVNAVHPEKRLVSKQSFVGGKRFTYSAEPVTKSMDRISQNPRAQYASPVAGLAYGWDDLSGVLELAAVPSTAGGGPARPAPPPPASSSSSSSSGSGSPQARVPAGQAGGGRFGSGGGQATAGKQPAKPDAHQQHLAHVAHLQHLAAVASQKAALMATAKDDQAKAAALIQQRNVLQKALASAGGKVSAGQAGSKTATTAKTKTTAPATASTAAAVPAASTTAVKAPAAAKTAATAKAAATAAPGTAAAKATAAQLTQQIGALNTQINQLLAAAKQATAQAAALK